MERYASKIIGILSRNNIAAVYSDETELVYALYITGYGEIHGILEYQEGRFGSYAIFFRPVPPDRLPRLLEYLPDVNTGEYCPGFFLDNQTNCVAFGIDYHADNANAEANQKAFEIFCLKAYDMFMEYLNPLCEIINGRKCNKLKI
ncbi:MAG: hypothetical protein LBS20_09200 [Prevotella sp.]|nr:hypothetical protein [Prevotella sp.]